MRDGTPVAGDLRARDAEHLEAARLQRAVADTVLAEGDETVMRGAAVGLDDKSEVGPEEVDAVAADRDLGFGHREAVVGTQLEEGGLELAVGCAAGTYASRSRRRRAWRAEVRGKSSRKTRSCARSRRSICPTAHGGLQLLVIEHRGEVGEGARERCDRDGVPLRDVVGSERGSAMNVDSGSADPAGMRRHRHLGAPRRPRLSDLPEGGGGEVTDRGALAAREDCRQPARLSHQLRSPDRIDAAVDPPQSTASQPARDRRGTQADFLELRVRHDAVLTARKRPDTRPGRFSSGIPVER